MPIIIHSSLRALQTQPNGRHLNVGKIAGLALALIVIIGAGYYTWNRFILPPASPLPPVPIGPSSVQVTGFVTQTGGVPRTVNIFLNNSLYSLVAVQLQPGTGAGTGNPEKFYYLTHLENHHVYSMIIGYDYYSRYWSGPSMCDAGKLTLDTQNATIRADVHC